MNTAFLCAVVVSVAVEHGYEEMPDGGIRYVVQIEPEMLEILRRGDPLSSTIPTEVRGRIHAIHIVSNYGPLSTEIPPLPEPGPTGEVTGAPKPLAERVEWSNPPAERDLGTPPGLLHGAGQVVQTSGTEPGAPLAGPSGTIPNEEVEQPDSTESKPWFPLVLAIIVATGSSSGMVFFGWLAFDYRSRYLGLLRDSVGTGDSWLDDSLAPADEPDMITFSDSASQIEDGSEGSPTEDSAWQDLGSESEHSLDDWLKEEKDPIRGSHDGAGESES